MGIVQTLRNLLTPSNNKFVLLAGSDPHVTQEFAGPSWPSYESLRPAFKSIEGQKWNAGILGGDIIIEAHKTTAQLKNMASQYRYKHKMYEVMGNHDWDSNGNDNFQKYIDPMGQNPLTSGVINSARPYPVSGTYDAYSWGTKNLNFIMMSDRNDLNSPSGEGDTTGTTVEKYRLSGAMTSAQWKYLHEQVFKNADKINVIVFHEAIFDTTLCSGLGEFTQYGGWSDYGREESDYRGCFGYVNNQLAVDDIQFFLEGVNGLIDFWLSGHVHHRIGFNYLGRSAYLSKYGIHHMNVANITKNAQNDPESENLTSHWWFLTFNNNSGIVNFRPWIFNDKDSVIPEGYYDDEAFNVSLNGSKSFNASYISPVVLSPSMSVSSLVIDNSTAGQLDLTFEKGSATGVLVVRKVGSHTAFTPLDDTAYYRGETVGDGVVAFMGSIEAFSDEGLTTSDDVYYTLFPFNGGGGSIKFKTSSPVQGNEIVT